MRDTILVVSPSAGGKTEALNVLRQEALARGISLEFKPLTDAHTILDRMYEDDEQGGRNHYHPWCPGEINGHSHDVEHPTIPFTYTGNEPAHAMLGDFFNGLAQLPYTGSLRFAEWSGGININEWSEPASRVDISFATCAEFLRKGTFNRTGLSRILAVIHPETDEEVRFALNNNRHLPTPEEIEYGTASWPLSDTAMRIFGRDDFAAVVPVLLEAGVSRNRIYTIYNDGDGKFSEQLKVVSTEILSTWRGGENPYNDRGRRK